MTNTTTTKRPASATTTVIGKPYDTQAYRRGRAAKLRERRSTAAESWETPITRAQERGEPGEWYDGFTDAEVGAPIYHLRDCRDCYGLSGDPCRW